MRGANLTNVLTSSVSFSFSLPCGQSYAELATSLKGASPELKEYLLVQSVAHLAADSAARKGKGVVEFVADALGLKR